MSYRPEEKHKTIAVNRIKWDFQAVLECVIIIIIYLFIQSFIHLLMYSF